MIILQTFDKIFEKLKIDKHFCTAVHRFQIGFINKNEEHMHFFGGNLTGIHTVRFSEKDFSEFYDDICNIDSDLIHHEVKKISLGKDERSRVSKTISEQKPITKDFNVSSDIFNLTCLYLIHRVLIDSKLSEHDRHICSTDLALILNYRFLTSLLNQYFRYTADIKAAQAAYAALSNRFLIKRLGSWKEVLVYRTKDLVDKNGIHFDNIYKYNDDKSIIDILNDHQGRVRDIIKNVYQEHLNVINNNTLIYTASSVGNDLEGTEIIKDKTRGLENYIKYLEDIIFDYDAFSKKELIGLVMEVSYTTNTNNLVNCLEYISKAYLTKENKLIVELLNLCVNVSFNYLNEHEFNITDRINIPTFLSKLKGCYTTAKTKDVNLERLREIGTEIVHKANGVINTQATISTRTSLFLYISLRTYTKSHYTN